MKVQGDGLTQTSTATLHCHPGRRAGIQPTGPQAGYQLYTAPTHGFWAPHQVRGDSERVRDDSERVRDDE